jgi:hypothetical protein
MPSKTASATPNVEQHFVNRDSQVRAIYDRIIEVAKKFGPVEEDPKKTSIHLNRRSAFAGIATRKDSLILTIKSTADIPDPRIIKREQASANRWHLEVRLSSPKEVDSTVKRWLETSYEISG